MFDFHEKRKLKSRIYSKPMVGGLLVIAILLSVSVYGRYEAEREMAKKKNELQTELETLKQHAASLESEVGRLKSDRGIEEEIRDRFEVSKKGEQVVVILGEEKATETPIRKIEDEPEEGFFDFLW